MLSRSSIWIYLLFQLVALANCFGSEQNKLIQAKLEGNAREDGSISILVATFNAGASSPPTACGSRFREAANNSLCHLLALNGSDPDLIVIALQEMTELSVENYFSIAMTANVKKKYEWMESLETTVMALGRYKLLKYCRLFGVFLIVYGNERVNATQVQSKSIGTGLFGRIGNKGAVGVSMVINGNLSLCFVNNHLAAGDSYKAMIQRSSALRKIRKKMVFEDGSALLDHSVVFWMGDFNYRLRGLSDTTEEVMDKCSKSNCKEMLQYDELKRYSREGNVLSGFQEPSISFRPTYKYEKGTTDWDRSEDSRTPAWCDRILYRAINGWTVEPKNYGSVESIVTSDHKPVAGVFVVKKDQGRKKRRYSGDNLFAQGELVNLDN